MGIVNGRPQSGYDNKLLTAADSQTIRVVGSWIKQNIVPSDEIHFRTSWGLGCLFQQETGIFLSENQFKDAMLLAGYAPVDPDETDWRFRIRMLRDTVENFNPFLDWATLNVDTESTQGTLIKDLLADSDFPIFANRSLIEDYLRTKYMNNDIIRLFSEIWDQYAADTQPLEDSKHLGSRKSWREWYDFYKFNPEGWSYEEMVDHIQYRNSDITPSIASLIVTMLQNLRGHNEQEFISYVTRQYDILINEYSKGYFLDTSSQLRILRSKLYEIESAYNGKGSQSLKYTLAQMVIQCYEMASLIGVHLDKEITDIIESGAKSPITQDSCSIEMNLVYEEENNDE